MLVSKSQLNPEQLEQLKVQELSQACQMGANNTIGKIPVPAQPIKKEAAVTLLPVASQTIKREQKKSGRGGKKEKWLLQSDLQQLSGLTEIGTEVEINTEEKVGTDHEEKEVKKEKEMKKEVKEEEEEEVKGEYWEEDSETRVDEKRKCSTEKVNWLHIIFNS